jgi:hypothetical protein
LDANFWTLWKQKVANIAPELDTIELFSICSCLFEHFF